LTFGKPPETIQKSRVNKQLGFKTTNKGLSQFVQRAWFTNTVKNY